jgi:hypothetical protein
LRLAVLALVVSSVALAEDAKVTVQAEVIHAQVKAGTIEPSLQQMQAALAKGKKYGALKRISTQKLTLQTQPPTVVPLPNGKSAEMSLVTLQQGVATIKLKVISQGEATLKLGRDGSLYQQAGEWEGGDLWLVLSQPK